VEEPVTRSLNKCYPTILTYELNGERVYVTAAHSYEEALDVAQKAFPDELQNISGDRIIFSMETDVESNNHTRITDMVWSEIIANVRQYTAIEVIVKPIEQTAKSNNRPTILTYQLNGKRAYVAAAYSYEEALDIAQKAFPDELQNISKDRIIFSFTTVSKHNIQITDMVWSETIADMSQYKLLDVIVKPITDERLPQYVGSKNDKIFDNKTE
jgi:SHS2 domain-containing protein